MAYVFKKKNQRTGRCYPEWRFRYKDVSGKWIQGVGWSDKQKTLDHARSVEAERRAIRKGEKEAPPAFLQNRNKPIDDVVAEYLAWGNAQGGRGGRPWAKMLAENRRRFLNHWIEDLHFTTLADIDVVKVEQRARETLKCRSGKTVAGQVEAIKALCYWAVKRNYLSHHPLVSMSRFDIRPTCPNRALTPEEIVKLMAVAPPHRQLWYKTALATGYRLSECAALKVRNLDLFGPSLPLAADFTKNRKDARQSISRDLADELTVFCEGRFPDDFLLDMPKKNTTGEHLYHDLAAANIRRKTNEGKATFHSFRVNYINAVIESGADLKTVMELARHGSAAMSMEVYAKAKPERLRAAAAAAHGYMQDQIDAVACGTGVAQQKTGTDDRLITANQHMEYAVVELISGLGFEPSPRIALRRVEYFRRRTDKSADCGVHAVRLCPSNPGCDIRPNTHDHDPVKCFLNVMPCRMPFINKDNVIVGPFPRQQAKLNQIDILATINEMKFRAEIGGNCLNQLCFPEAGVSRD